MSHEVEKMFYVGEVPWHGLGTALESAPTTADAIKAAGLDWKVVTKPLKTFNSPTSDREPGGLLHADLEVPAKAIVRETDSRVLGVVGKDWTPLQNAEVFKFFDPFVSTGQAMLETAGSLREGQRVWVLARLALEPSVVVPGDEIRKYVLLSNSHDGSLAVRVGFTPIRVVCANTEAMARESAASRLLRIRHTKNVESALAAVAEVMNVANADFEATVEQYRLLARKDVSAEDLKKYVNLVFAPKRVEKAIAEKALIAGEDAAPLTADQLRSNVYPKIVELFEGGKGNQLPGVRGTLWGAYNAISEYLGNERGADRAKRLDQLWFGGGAKLNQRALKVGVELAAA